MTLSFGKTLELARISIEEEAAVKSRMESVTLIRDIYGKVRVLLETLEGHSDPTEEELNALATNLTTKLGAYFGNDIWLASEKRDGHQSLVNKVQRERVEAKWDDETQHPRWYVLERHISKKAWTATGEGRPPWPQTIVHAGHKPAIVSFFSFKGGLGRTTTLVGTALALSRKGHRVAIVDLDLEAPGLASLFFPDTEMNHEDTGVIDYLIERPIQRERWPVRTSVKQINNPIILGQNGETIKLISAGMVDGLYLEKLARLDFQHMLEENLANTLRDMMNDLVRTEALGLDFIFLDARAGFHDIGGLTVAELAHASVLIGNHTRQTWAGLTQVIHRLARPTAQSASPVILAHAMAPSLVSESGRREIRNFREKAYLVFQEHYYAEGEDVPNERTDDAPFWPVVLPWDEMLRGDISLFKSEETPEEEMRLSELVRKLTSDPYETLARRICNEFGKSFEQG